MIHKKPLRERLFPVQAFVPIKHYELVKLSNKSITQIIRLAFSKEATKIEKELDFYNEQNQTNENQPE